jgi:pyruvate-ferredoxin/flavodoxin oxidoreductase
LFEKTRVVVDGSAKHACHLIAGALDRVTITPELERKIAHVAANCVAEIIHEH